jgi:NAD(P)-dependent dehydrogenase (short-subunit alcohol dehydrogenase family)
MRTVFVTGAASGIGRATAERFAGDTVFLADIREGELDDACLAISACGGIAVPVLCDVRSEADVIAALGKVSAESGVLDVLVVNAGVTTECLIEHMTLEDWAFVHDVNLTGAFLCLKHSVPLLRSSDAASVVTVGSISGRVIGAGRGCAAYESSKAALVQLTRAFAAEHAAEGIRANTVSPGRVATALGRHSEELRCTVLTSESNGRTAVARPPLPPLARAGTPEEISDLVFYLSSPAAAFVTGAEFTIDGGATLQ